MAKHMRAAHYTAVYLALVALTLSSFGLSRLHLPGDVAIALSIAAAKTLLVGLVFMHLIEQRLANRLAPVVAGVLAGILIVLTAADVATRQTFPKGPAPPTERGQRDAPLGR
jgi:caa(3)-type oxidase subunit IV